MDNQISKVADKLTKLEDLEKKDLVWMDERQKERKKRKLQMIKHKNMRIKNLAEIKIFKRNYKKLNEKIGAATAVLKNREKIKHSVNGGIIDIDNKQNRRIFESILDESKVLKERIKKYKEMPGKYNDVKPKYLDIKAKQEEGEKSQLELAFEKIKIKYINPRGNTVDVDDYRYKPEM